jgi:DNA-directed RNA polymerase alpha subunit
MSTRTYKTYSADGLIVVIEKNSTDINVLKEIVHEIPFRIKAFNKLAPYLKKAEAIIAGNEKTEAEVSMSALKQNNNSATLMPGQPEAIIEQQLNQAAVKDSRSQIKNIKLEDLELRSLEYNCLKAERILDLKDLVQKTEIDLLKIPNFRKTSLTRIVELLEDYGLTLGMKLDVRASSEVIQNTPPVVVSASNLSPSEQDFLAKAVIAANAKDEISSSVLKKDNKPIVLEPRESQTVIEEQDIPNSVEDSQPKTKNIMLEHLELRAREYRCLKSEGVLDLKELVQKTEADLLKIPSFGKTSLTNLNELLEYHGLTLGMNPDVIVDSEVIQNSAPISAPNLKLEDLDLSVREQKCLESKGILDLKALVKKTRVDLLKIPNFGKTSLGYLTERLSNHGLSLDMESSDVIWIDQIKLERQNDRKYIPRKFDGSKNFGDSIGDFIEQYSKTIPKKSQQLIFEKRIAHKTKNIPTLADLSRELGVTRERVRQVERKVIRLLIKVIFNRSVLKGNHRVDIDFSARWEIVATNFRDLDEVTVTDFVSELLTSWNVSYNDLEEYFNFVSVIYTGKVKSHLVSQNRTFESRILPLREKFKATSDTKISKLRLQKGTKYFADLGLFTIGDFLVGRNNINSSYNDRLVQVLDSIELTYTGSIDWAAYIKLNNLEMIGEDQYENSEDFLYGLHDAVARIIELLDLWTHSKEVFTFRTSKHPKNRPTLMAAAEKILGKPAHGPVIARMQSHFLENIRLIFIDKDYSHAKFWIAKGFVNQVDKAREIHDFAEGDFEKFIYLIRLRWGIKNPDLDSISVLWTILDGYTPQRYFHLSAGEIQKRRAKKQPKLIETKIKLSGFRDVY